MYPFRAAISLVLFRSAISLVLTILWVIYLAYMIITKKDKEKIKQLFFLGLFFIAIWVGTYLLIF